MMLHFFEPRILRIERILLGFVDLGCRGTGVSLLPRLAKRVKIGSVDTPVYSGGCVK